MKVMCNGDLQILVRRMKGSRLNRVPLSCGCNWRVGYSTRFEPPLAVQSHNQRLSDSPILGYSHDLGLSLANVIGFVYREFTVPAGSGSSKSYTSQGTRPKWSHRVYLDGYISHSTNPQLIDNPQNSNSTKLYDYK